MKLGTIGLAIALGLGLVAIGCGAPEKSRTERAIETMSDDVDPVSAAVGDVKTIPVEQEVVEKPSEAPVAPEPESAGETIEGTQGAFIATIKVLGKEEPGTYKVLTASADPIVVKEGLKTGEEVRLEPGTYDFEFTTPAIAGGKTMTLTGVEIPMGRVVKREVKIQAGRLTLVTGGKCVKSAIRIKEKGSENWLPGKFFTCQEIVLPAGYYDAERGSTPISGIQVYDGGIQQVLIRPKG
jgi:hypothetical protein